jgi:ATP-dependent Clp protease ATP-binding subunit ClpA
VFERFARTARAAVEDARLEAERRGDRRIGSEHLLIALLQDDGLAAVAGVDAGTARDTADRIDCSALAAIGLTLGEFHPSTPGAIGRRVPFMTAGAKAVIRRALTEAAAEKAHTITSRHMLLAVLDRAEPDPAASLLAELSIDRAALRERLAAHAGT